MIVSRGPTLQFETIMINLTHPDYMDLRTHIRESPDDFVVISGAGLSRPCGLPSFPELRASLVENAQHRVAALPESEQDGRHSVLARVSSTLDLWGAITELKTILGEEAFHAAVRKALEITNPGSVPVNYDLLWQLGIKGLITFNLDLCAVHSFARTLHHAADTATAQEPSKFRQFLLGKQRFVFQPHGTLTDAESWVLTHTALRKLHANADYLRFMRSLCDTRHLLIIGFNPADFAFEYLLQSALYLPPGSPVRHYAFLPTQDQVLLSRLSDKGIAVIPYLPEDPIRHAEIESALRDMLAFVPTDGVPPSVNSAVPTLGFSVPPADELASQSLDDLRTTLNSAVATMLPPGSPATKAQIESLDRFYRDYIRPIHNAWLLQPNSPYDQLFGYKLLKSLGRGAFGQVYEAELKDCAARVAIKVLLPEVKSDREYLNSFRRGVQSMRILTSNHISGMVKIHDAYEIPACIVMDLVDGPTLREAKERGFLSEMREVLHVLARVAEVVQSAHALDERVLHRDLKPDNVILQGLFKTGDSYEVVVLDFDLSWHVGASELSVVHGARAQGYAAPEQTATGRLGGVTTRHTAVDSFGLGMLAYFMVTGLDPRPNSHRFPEFHNQIRTKVESQFSSNWKCTAEYLAQLIEDSTRERQTDRLPFATVTTMLSTLRDIFDRSSIPSVHPILLLEIACRLDPDGQFRITDFGRTILINSVGSSKQTILRLQNRGEKLEIETSLGKSREVHDHRNISKYMAIAKDRVSSRLNKGGFRFVRSSTGRDDLQVSGVWHLEVETTRQEIERFVEVVFDARSLLKFD